MEGVILRARRGNGARTYPAPPELAGKVIRTGYGVMMPACTYAWGGGCIDKPNVWDGRRV
jgi:hypothetical protein